MVQPFRLITPGRILFGDGTIRQVGREAKALGRRALVLTGGMSLQASGRLNEIVGLLGEAGLQATVFSGVEPEPSLDTVERGRQRLREARCDVVIAVGGGSALDVGKAIAALANEAEPVEVFHAGKEITKPGLPSICAPTTAGTGSEVTPNSVLTNARTSYKASIRGGDLMPRIAIVDPELTHTLPPRETAYSGLDALVQAIESFTSRGANPVTDLLAREAIQRIAKALPRAYEDSANAEARADVALGSLLAGIALANARLGLVHGLAHPVGATWHIPHGLACALLLPHVMRFNLEAARAKYARLAEDLCLEGGAEAFVRHAVDLCARLGAAGPLRDYGAREEDIEGMVEPTLASGSTQHNPRPVTAEDVRAMLREAV
jgi:alcohol dehydrogenase class IV